MDEAAIAVLRATLRERLRETGQIAGRIEERQARFHESAEGVDSMAYQLHNLYGAFEQLFEEVARSFENQIDGERYHTDLLRRMKLEIEGVRPALLSEQTFTQLDELRRFRHFFRHAYSADLDPAKVTDLVTRAQQLRELIQQDTDRFLDRLAS